MNYKNELAKISKTIEERKTEKTKLETNLENLKNDREKIIAELSKLGVKENEIDKLKKIVADLEINIEEEITKVKKELGE